MIIKYRTDSYGKFIERFEIERETESSVWIKGRRSNKISSYHKYWDTFNDAKEYLLSKSKNRIESIECSLQREKENLADIEAVTEEMT